jgi:hypothetical protein
VSIKVPSNLRSVMLTTKENNLWFWEFLLQPLIGIISVMLTVIGCKFTQSRVCIGWYLLLTYLQYFIINCVTSTMVLDMLNTDYIIQLMIKLGPVPEAFRHPHEYHLSISNLYSSMTDHCGLCEMWSYWTGHVCCICW